MPIYEYRCTQCGHKLEALQKFSDAPLSTCPACGKEALSKLVSAAGFQLKGSGWYQTDFRGGGSKPAAKSEGAEGAKGEGKSDSAEAPASKDSTSAGDKAAASTPAAPSSPPAASGTSAT